MKHIRAHAAAIVHETFLRRLEIAMNLLGKLMPTLSGAELQALSFMGVGAAAVWLAESMDRVHARRGN